MINAKKIVNESSETVTVETANGTVQLAPGASLENVSVREDVRNVCKVTERLRG